MDFNGIPAQQWLFYAAAIGFVIGLVPLIAGIFKGNIKYGLFGLIGSIIGGAFLGLILAVPVSAVFTWLIFRGREGQDNSPAEGSDV